jgi:putative ubiquitin-RnfH superfamily antitoxin RatB of RatAB toxin-antitoxin module
VRKKSGPESAPIFLTIGRVRRDLLPARQELQELPPRQGRRRAAGRIQEIRPVELQAVSVLDSPLCRRAHTHTVEDRPAVELGPPLLALPAKEARRPQGHALHRLAHPVLHHLEVGQNLLEDPRHQRQQRTVCYRP